MLGLLKHLPAAALGLALALAGVPAAAQPMEIGPWVVERPLVVDGPVRVDGALVVSGNARVNGPVDVAAMENLPTAGVPLFRGEARHVRGPLTVHGSLTVYGDLRVRGPLTVRGPLRLGGTLEANGPVRERRWH